MTKFHLPHPAQTTRPLCDRQVFNHRQRVSQDQDGVLIAVDTAEFEKALGALRPKACRTCARQAGLLPALPPRTRHGDDESEAEREVERLLFEQELDEEDGGEDGE